MVRPMASNDVNRANRSGDEFCGIPHWIIYRVRSTFDWNQTRTDGVENKGKQWNAVKS